jgi:hypothetical protein
MPAILAGIRASGTINDRRHYMNKHGTTKAISRPRHKQT